MVKMFKCFVAGLVGGWLVACSTDGEVAGVSTVETENAYVVQVVDESGAPVANATAVLRAANYLPALEVLKKETAVRIFTSDSVGIVRVDTLFADSMTLEVMDEGRGAFALLLANQIKMGDSSEIAVSPLSVMSGRIDLPEGSDGVWIQVYGTDRKVKTDSEGFYKIEGLAPADYRVRIVAGDSIVEDLVTVPLAAPESSSSGQIAESSSSDEPESSSDEEPGSSASLGYLNVLDFENGLKSNVLFAGDSSELYLKPTDTTVVMSPVEDSAALAVVDAGAGREGKAFHWTTSGMQGHWSFMGLWICSSSDPCDFSGIDSVEYFVRGTGSYSFNLEAIVDGTSGKAVFLDTLGGADEWERVVVKPSDFMVGDSTYGNMGWDYVSKQATNIAVSAYFDTEIWIDDIKFYGVNEKDLR